MIAVAPRCISIRMSPAEARSGMIGKGRNRPPPGAPVASVCTDCTDSRRHLCTRLAFRPCTSAMAAKDAPGCAHSLTTCAFSSLLCRRHKRIFGSMVSTKKLGGHHLPGLNRLFQDVLPGRLRTITASAPSPHARHKPAPPTQKAPGMAAGGFSNTSLTMTYFHTGCSTIIGAKSFHGPVRDGMGWDRLAMVIRHNL
ncbi:MAG: hypothetical protein V7642_2958 [Burkholderiales bacterium]